jgi:hypothetical protein
VAYAEMELYTNKNAKIALQIFDLAFKIFNTSTNFLLLYVDFLFRLHEDINIRALLEKILNQVTLDKAQEVWSTYLKYEKLSGPLANVESLEKRKMEAYHESPLAMMNLVQRYRYLDLWPCSINELVNYETISDSSKQLIKQFLAQKTGGLTLAKTDQQVEQNYTQVFNKKLINKEKFAKPDLSKLVAFNAEDIGMSFSLGNGEIISVPANLLHFINALSKPINNAKWEGVKVDVPALMDLITAAQLKDPRDTDVLVRKKRKYDEQEGSKNTTDIFRERQSYKIQRQSADNMKEGGNRPKKY